MSYCFVCDAPVDDEVCPTCGTVTWTDQPQQPAGQTPPQATEQPLDPGPFQSQPSETRPLARQPAPATPAVSTESGGVLHLDAVPELADHSPVERTDSFPRWPLAAALVMVLVLVAVRIPSGREDVQDETVGEIPIPATPLPEPQSYDLVFVPRDNTTISVLGAGNNPVLAIRRYGPLDPIYASSVSSRNNDLELNAVDITPDGLAVTWQEGRVELWSPSVGQVDQLATGVSASPLLSPNGRLLAVPIDNAVFVYDVGSSSPGRTAEVVSSGVSDVRLDQIHWSADGAIVAGGNQTEWVAYDATSGVAVNRGPGQLLAVHSRQGAAVRVEDDVEWRIGEDTIQRTWPDLLDPDPSRYSPGEFSPNGRYLAVQSTRPDDAAVWVLDLNTREQFRVGTRPGIGSDRPLMWSGDGNALYWLDGTQLVAWLVNTRQTVLIAERDDVEDFPSRIHGIRTYDQALVVTSSSINSAPAPTPTVGADGLVFSQFDRSVVVDGDVLDLPPDGTIVRGVALGSENARRLGVELDDGRIVFEAGETWTATTEGAVAIDGFSLTSLGSQFMWIADGDLYSEASFPEPVLPAARLGNGSIAAVVGVRDSLVLAFQDAGGVTQLWQVPAWSDALSIPLMVNRGEVLPSSPFTITGTWLGASEVSMSRNHDGDAFSVTLSPRGGQLQTTVFFYPETDISSVCGVQLGACQGPTTAGTAVTFSPDGHWVLVDVAGPNVALSLQGRGTVEVGDDDSLWTE